MKDFNASRAYYIPKGAVKVTMKSGGATFYLYKNAADQNCAMCFVGNAQKPTWRFRFLTEADRTKKIKAQIEAVNARSAEMAKRRSERNKAHSLEKGLILYTSWGYDQTNTEFFEIVDVPSKNFVTLQEIAAPLTNGEEGFMSGNRMPDPETKIGAPFRRKVNMSGGSPSISIDSCRNAWVWDGKSKRVSWYA